MSSLLFYFTKIISMKKLIGSKSRSAIIIAILFIIFSISNGCTKNTMSDLTGPISNKDNSGFKGGTDTTEVIVAGLNPIPEIITSVVSVPPLNPELSLLLMGPVKSDIVFFVQPFEILNMIKRIAIIIADLLLEPINFFILIILVK